MNSISSATILEIVGSSISAKFGAIGTDPFNQGTIYSGRARALVVDASDGSVEAAADYLETIWNATSSSLAAGDWVLAIPGKDKDGNDVVFAVSKIT